MRLETVILMLPFRFLFAGLSDYRKGYNQSFKLVFFTFCQVMK